MAAKKILATLGIIGLGAIVLKSIKGKVDSYKFLDFSIGNVSVKIINALTIQLDIKINVYNPNKLVVPIEGVFGTVATESGVALGNFIHKDLINISGQQRASFNIIHRAGTAKIIQLVAQIIMSNQLSRKVIVKGMMKTSFFDQEFSQNLNLS